MSDVLADMGRILYSPNDTLFRIHNNPGPYVTMSIVILALASIFAIGSGNLEETDKYISGFGYILTADQIALTSISGFIASVISIVMIYFVGGWLGTKSDFKKVFCMMSYPVMPVLIGGLVTVGYFFMFMFLLEHESQTGAAEAIAVMQLNGFLGYIGLYLPFIIWTLILTIKAIKRTHEVSTMRAIAVVIIATIISAFATMPFGWAL